MIKPIDSQQPLALAFNKVISKVVTLDIITRPRIFADTRGKEASFRMMYHYQIALWEDWLHGVVSRLEDWVNIIDEYFDEFNGSWRYYALSKRMDSIREYGGDDDDYNDDGSIKTNDIRQEQLRYHTVFYDLYHDCVDIVQDTVPDDLLPLIETIDTDSRFSIDNVLRNVAGKTIPTYMVRADGELHVMSFADKALRQASKMVEAEDLGRLVYDVANIMSRLTSEIETIAKSDSAFSDQHELLYAIQNDAYALLNLKFEETRFFGK